MSVNTARCIGCSACVDTCPLNAISLKYNNEGFYTSTIDFNLCVNCGKCNEVCPLAVETDFITNKYIDAYAAYSKDNNIIKQSTSGGIFYTIAEEFIKKHNGYVFGVAFDENLVAKHICVNDVKSLYKLMGSKYVQSDLNNTFKEVKKLLNNNEYVLFSGTGCQITGLKLYLKKEYENLFTVDLICHGVPSPGLFKDYIGFLGKKYKSNVVEYKFRQKNNNTVGQSYDTKIVFQKGNNIKTKYINGDDDVYTNNYLTNKLQSNICFNCKFTSLKRSGDITLGDYWGVHKVHPELKETSDISLVLVNSEKGELLFDSVKAGLNVIKTNEDKMLKFNNQLKSPPEKHLKRDELYYKYCESKFDRKFYYTQFIGKELGVYLIKRHILRLLKLLK